VSSGSFVPESHEANTLSPYSMLNTQCHNLLGKFITGNSCLTANLGLQEPNRTHAELDILVFVFEYGVVG